MGARVTELPGSRDDSVSQLVKVLSEPTIMAAATPERLEYFDFEQGRVALCQEVAGSAG
ncbi:hypothetical protein [Mycobacterium sp. SMC-13]|uniref:hypothetical protein n=1 Tax=Mycobacterium sp. SMC-13 TaxID=3381626 RepID=UPI003877FBE3